MRIRTVTPDEYPAGILIHGLFRIREALEIFASGEIQRKLIPGIMEKIPKSHRVSPKMQVDFSGRAVKQNQNANVFYECRRVLDGCAAEGLEDFVNKIFSAIAETFKGGDKFFFRIFGMPDGTKFESLPLKRELKKEEPAPIAKLIETLLAFNDAIEEIGEMLGIKRESWIDYPGALNYETRRGYCFVGAVRSATARARGIRQQADIRPRQTRTRGRVS